MKNNYTPSKVGLTAFNCPYCNVFGNFTWFNVQGLNEFRSYGSCEGLEITRCIKCRQQVIAHNKKIVIPKTSEADTPHDDLPEDIKRDYCEAMNILTDSPRSSCALLRLAIEKLCKELGCKGNDINSNIAKLVEQGLPINVQKSLDVIRVVGNNAVHPGEIDIDDNPEIAVAMFKLINFITEKMITEPKEVESIYNSLPAKNLEAIHKRDNKK